jgi:hypothetical protein
LSGFLSRPGSALNSNSAPAKHQCSMLLTNSTAAQPQIKLLNELI